MDHRITARRPLASYLNRDQTSRGAKLHLNLDENDAVIITV